MSKKRVMLVDDNVLMRHAVRSLFDSHPSFFVCGEAEHGRDAVEQAPQLRPDLIVIDLTMPVMSGLVAAPLLIKVLPDVWIILLTMHDYPDVLQASKAAGIHAVVSKSKASTHLIPQAESLVEGRAFSG
jgi:two-component system nitrate/nitrite response regulator NarL